MPVVANRHRCRLDGRHHIGVGRGGVAPDRAAVVARAVGEELVEPLLEPLGLLRGRLHRRQRRVDRAVEHHAAHALRVERRVEGTELGAVGEADEADPVLAEPTPDALHVSNRGEGGDVPQEAGVAPAAARLREATTHVVEGAPLRGVVGRRVAGEEVVETPTAVDRRARADAPGIPADHVEPVGDRLREEPARSLGELDPRRAGTARVHEQRTDPVTLVACGHTQQRELRASVPRRRARRCRSRCRRAARRGVRTRHRRRRTT